MLSGGSSPWPRNPRIVSSSLICLFGNTGQSVPEENNKLLFVLFKCAQKALLECKN